jgi:hypothetical protein
VATALEAQDLVVGDIGDMVALISKHSVTPLLPLSVTLPPLPLPLPALPPPFPPLPLPLTFLVPLPEPPRPALSLSIIDAGLMYLSLLPKNFWLVATAFYKGLCQQILLSI